MLCHATPQTVEPDRPHALSKARRSPRRCPDWAGMAPDWRGTPPGAEPHLPAPLAPSRPENAALGAVPQADSPLAERDAAGMRFRRGQMVHTLLQHLPALPPDERAEAARSFLARPGSGVPEGAVAGLLGSILAVLDHPDLAPLFGPDGRAEVPLTGVVAGQRGGWAGGPAGGVAGPCFCWPTTRPTAPRPPRRPRCRRCICARWRPIARCYRRFFPAGR